MTQRTGFVLRVRPERIDEYVAAHRQVWPEMLDALRGRRHPQLHDLPRRAPTCSATSRPTTSRPPARHMAAQEVNTRWQDAMASCSRRASMTAPRRRCQRSSGSID